MLSNPVREWYQTKVELQYGQLGPVMAWCERNCINEWYLTESTDVVEQFNGHYKFFFESERDYINFIVWKK